MNVLSEREVTKLLEVIDYEARHSVPHHSPTPAERIVHQNMSVDSMCGSFANPQIALAVNQVAGRRFRSSISTHPAGLHVYLVERARNPERDKIVDPTAGQFFDFRRMPDRLRELFRGNMFLGSRESIRQIYEDDESIRRGLGFYVNFSTIWGEDSRDFAMFGRGTADDFYGFPLRRGR